MKTAVVSLVSLMWAVGLLWAQASAGPQRNLIPNGDMEADADGDGVPDVWEATGNPGYVTQRLSGDEGRGGGRSLRLDCRRIEPIRPDAHAMVCQVGQVAVKAGQWYKLTLWARQEGLDETAISVALSNTQGWSNLGLHDSFLAVADWQEKTFYFQATADAHRTTRLQIWYLSPGTLWLDDVTLTETTYKAGPTLLWPAGGRRNLVPNGSFELGPDGWGSMGTFEPGRGWRMDLNALVGSVSESGGAVGERCLEIQLSPETVPISYFDYFGMTGSRLLRLLTGTIGYLETEPGATYCLSAWVRANRDDVPVLLGIQPFYGALNVAREIAGREWRRVSIPVQVVHEHVFPLIGLDWERAGPQPVTLWIDGVQFERGEQPTDFVPREPVEAGVSTSREGNVFFTGQPVRVNLAATNVSGEPALLELRVTDYADTTVLTRQFRVATNRRRWRETVDLGLTRRGFYRVHLSINGVEKPRGMRLALIPQYRASDSIFGVNHAWPWAHLERLAVAAGIGWARDWSIKWQDVQPAEDAPFDFAESDIQINRALSFGQQVLGLLPFPSANWSSSAPPEVVAGDTYPASRARMAFAPRDEREFARWVSETVRHYKDRIKWWQVFNEPIYTGYSLPDEHGYTGADYARWAKVFYQAAKAADPDCFVLAGIGAWPTYGNRHFTTMFEAGALDYLDAVDVHVYPGLSSPEATAKELANLHRLMDEHGGRKPIWLTEHGYYADDDVEQIPIQHGGFNIPLPSERVQAQYSMRFNVMLLAAGVERIFYHAGTCPALNRDNTEGIFFEYGGSPRKIYAALAALADLFRPGVEPLGEQDWGPGAKAYLFRQGAQLILAAWTRSAAEPVTVTWSDTRVTVRDMMGNTLPRRAVTLSADPLFLVAEGLSPAEFRRAIGH